MTFTNPIMLAALAAVSVPIIIHLIHRRRARNRPFSAVEFVLRSRRAVQRKFRLKQLILLILRCLMLAAIGLALAKPLAGALSASATAVEGPAAVVLLVDNSMSMQAMVDGETAFEAAQRQAAEIIDSLAPESEAAIVAFNEATKDLTGGLTADRDVLKAGLADLEVGYRGTDVGAALDVAENLLSRSDQQTKIAIVLTDMAEIGWKGVRRREVADSAQITWRIVDVTGGPAPDNLVATGLSYREEPGSALAVTLTATSYAAKLKESVACELVVDGAGAGKGFVDLEPGASATKRFTVGSPPAGIHRAAGRVAADALTADDTRYLIFRGRARLRALVIDGDPTTLIREAETFYLERALLPRRGLAGDLAPTIIDPEGLNKANLSKYDVIVLANVSDIPSVTAGRLREFVKGGGGLLISVGDRVNPKQLNGLLNDLMPMRVRGWREAAPQASATGKGPLFIEPFPSDHPILSVFHDESLAVFGEARFNKVALLERGSADTQVLLKFNDGTPALVEHSVGQGRVILFASTLDRGWTDLPIATVYLPLFRRTVRYLGGDLEAGGDNEAMIGVPFSIRAGDPHTTVRVIGPTQTETHDLAVVDGIAEFTPDAPGFYQVVKADGTEDPQLLRRSFAANVNAEEGDLRKIDSETLSGLFAEGLEIAGMQSGKGNNKPSRPYWGWLLLVGVMALVTEGVLTR